MSHFLIQLLFCLFAEDTGLLPDRLFTGLVEQTRTRPQAFKVQLEQLFAAMSTGGWFGPVEIMHFNGKLFEDSRGLELDGECMDILVRVSRVNWSSIEPSILGTLFERSLDPSKRAQLGAHYTSKEDIMLIVEPVLMAPLRKKWAAMKAQAHDLAMQRDQAKGRRAANLQDKLASLLLDFAAELAGVRVLDPACGSGNFLYVALRQLLDLWKEVSVLAFELALHSLAPTTGLSPSPAQLHGIEVIEYANQLAQATIQIGYIRLMDAILAYDEEGRPVEPKWPIADVIIGNPPFLGWNKIRQELGDMYVNDLFHLYAGRIPAFADLVCYWFEKSRALLAEGKAKRSGLLATNSIRGGANRRVLERIKETGNIFWAQSDRDWILEGAAVNVSMVGFDDASELSCILDNRQVININPDLTSTIDLTAALRLRENQGICFMGASPKGPFDIKWDTAQQMLLSPTNVNGRPNSDVVRPVASGIDLVQRPREFWTIDFGLMSLQEAAQYERPFEYVKNQM